MRREKMRRLTARDVKAGRRLQGGPGWNKGLTKETHPSVEKQAAAMRGKPKSEEHKIKLSDAIFGTKMSAESSIKKSRSLKKAWRRARSNTETGLYSDVRRATLKKAAEHRRYIPWGQWKNIGKKNRAEAKLERFLKIAFPGEFKYVGDKQVCIGRRFPDFINVNGRKELIELFGDHVHGPEFTGRRRCDESRSKKAHYKKFGFRTAVVWTKQLNNEEKLLQSIQQQLAR
jgi:very-short-patch-repair endonuclease